MRASHRPCGPKREHRRRSGESITRKMMENADTCPISVKVTDLSHKWQKYHWNVSIFQYLRNFFSNRSNRYFWRELNVSNLTSTLAAATWRIIFYRIDQKKVERSKYRHYPQTKKVIALGNRVNTCAPPCIIMQCGDNNILMNKEIEISIEWFLINICRVDYNMRKNNVKIEHACIFNIYPNVLYRHLIR